MYKSTLYLYDIDSVLLGVAPSCRAHPALRSFVTLDDPGLREGTPLRFIILGEAGRIGNKQSLEHDR